MYRTNKYVRFKTEEECDRFIQMYGGFKSYWMKEKYGLNCVSIKKNNEEFNEIVKALDLVKKNTWWQYRKHRKKAA